MNKQLKEVIYSDLYRYTANTSIKVFLRNLLLNPGFQYMYVFRKCQFYHGKKRYFIHYLFHRVWLRKLMYKYGYEIPYTTKIGKGFYIGHVGGIAVNPNATIGNNVNISQGVTIGQANRGKLKGAPTIGNNVWIGPNAVIVGNIKIGNNVLIAGGAFVNFDVPDNSIVIGNPGKIIRSENATDGYINNII